MIGVGEPPADLAGRGRELIATLMVDGEPVAPSGDAAQQPPLERARETLRRSLAELPISATQLSRGDAVIPTVYENV